MTIFPNAKINIGLRIISKREDGFHNIESVFYPIGLCDALEFVIQLPENNTDEFVVTGLLTDCPAESNLVMKALKLLRKDYHIPGLRIHLHKCIPAGAGLGGGSSDAAFMLKYLNRCFNLKLSNNDLIKYALELGSDCPFFINNNPVIATGKGEIMNDTKMDLKGKHILIIQPSIHINTSMAYSLITPAVPTNKLSEQINAPVKDWVKHISNDFEPAIFRLHPEISDIKDQMYRRGAIYSSMSGSGSSVYGIFDYAPPGDIAGNLWSWTGSL